MVKKIPVKIRISGLGRSKDNKYPNRKIDGDLMIYNETYKSYVEVLMTWQPSPQIKRFIDKNKINFLATMKSHNIELYFYYPRSFRELCDFIEKEYNADEHITLSIIDNFKDLQILFDHLRSLQE